jgi:hypothetical protein
MGSPARQSLSFRSMAVKAKIASNKHLIYRDRAPVSASESFLNRVARQQGE